MHHQHPSSPPTNPSIYLSISVNHLTNQVQIPCFNYHVDFLILLIYFHPNCGHPLSDKHALEIYHLFILHHLLRWGANLHPLNIQLFGIVTFFRIFSLYLFIDMVLIISPMEILQSYQQVHRQPCPQQYYYILHTIWHMLFK